MKGGLFQAHSQSDISGSFYRANKVQSIIAVGVFTFSKPTTNLSVFQISEAMRNVLISD